MARYADTLAALGVHVPEILLPASGSDYPAWAVVACDQYSSEREYWEGVKALVGSRPSTLNLIFPECYLKDADKTRRVERIQRFMREYLERGVLANAGKGFVIVERTTPSRREPRKGLVMAVDLEKYEYDKGSKSLIRSTEGTIVERLPPRMQIRRGAPLEVPHIMVLIDDREKTVVEPLYAARRSLPPLYDFDLMSGSGHLRGWHARDEGLLAQAADALTKLADAVTFRNRYGTEDVLLFAVGDGNHSLATAKAIWEETKKEDKGGSAALSSHPARYALVELVNIYDEGLPFHPIHRVLFGLDEAGFFEALRTCQRCSIERMDSSDTACARVDQPATEQRIAFVSARGSGVVTFPKPSAHLAAGTIQDFLDPYLDAHPAIGIDYVHGTETLVTLAMKDGNLGLYLPPVDKAGFFGTVIRDGVMPRKTFSMGEAPEKRFYVEARRIVR
jgi:hypothetical protein